MASAYQALVERHENSPTLTAAIDKLIIQLVDSDRDFAKQFQTTAKRNSLEGSVAADLYAMAMKLRQKAADQKVTGVASLPLEPIVKRIKAKRIDLELDASGQKEYLEAIAATEAAKGLSRTQGSA